MDAAFATADGQVLFATNKLSPSILALVKTAETVFAEKENAFATTVGLVIAAAFNQILA